MEDDYVLALRLQREFDQEHSTNAENQTSSEDLSDLDLAYRLQAEYDAEINDDGEDCVIVSLNGKAKSSQDLDHDLAVQLQKEWEDANKKSVPTPSPQKGKVVKSGGNGSIVDTSWELVDPCPDIHALFLEFNGTYFWGKLEGVEVRWSPRMTLCAGLCVYEGRGGLCSVRLSKPLLKLRPRRDLVQTLLHEMIHAYLFVTQNNKDHDAHGPEFHKHMYRINKSAGTSITVYHSFHAEVALYKQHWWRCNGVCRDRKPFYGWVKRSMNRAPSPRDFWWPEHQRTCSGNFIKVKSPEPAKPTKPQAAKDEKKQKDKDNSVKGMQDIRKLFSPQPKKLKVEGDDSSVKTIHMPNYVFPGKGHVLGKF